jgi:uncharacterized protein
VGCRHGGQVRAVQGQVGEVPVPAQASNGQVIAVGEAYESKASVVKGIESVRKNAGDATVDDLI